MELKPAYLIHGDDHGAVAERRAGLRALAEAGDGGGGSVELLEGDAATPAGVAGALAAMTLSMGRRVIIVDGVERWREADVKSDLAPAMGSIDPDTTLALFAREEARAKAPDALAEAVRRAGGQVVEQMTVKPWELPTWVCEQGARLGMSLDKAAAKALVGQVGERQQRLLRELEKLALEQDLAEGTHTLTAEQIEDRASSSAEWRAYALADALLSGDGPLASECYLGLREQGERLSGLSYLLAQRLREALAVAERLQAGESAAQLKRTLRMPSRAADRFIAEASSADPERLRRALGVLADLELDSRGGSPLSFRRSPIAALDEDTVALRAISAITS